MVLWESRAVGAMGEGRTCRGEMLSAIEITGGGVLRTVGSWAMNTGGCGHLDARGCSDTRHKTSEAWDTGLLMHGAVGAPGSCGSPGELWAPWMQGA